LKTLHHTLIELGKWLGQKASLDSELFRLAEAHNGWFTEDSVKTALSVHAESLNEKNLNLWLDAYSLSDVSVESNGKKIGLITAGNIPLVGLHDILCGLATGFEVVVKASRDDVVLPRAVVNDLEGINPDLKGRITFIDGLLGDVDAIIATGSSNTMRYFESYFRDTPHVFRSQRTGVAFLNGEETHEELVSVGNDIFTHFGLGCRSTTKLFLPEGFDMDRLFAAWVDWGFLAKNNKYANNYDYYKAIWLLNREELLENGFLIVKKDTGWVSPVGTLFVEFYNDEDLIINRLADYSDGLQLVTSSSNNQGFSDKLKLASNVISQASFGEAQCPTLLDYADGVDTMEFLLNLK